MPKKLGAVGYPIYFGPFTVIFEMETGFYFVKKLEQKEFSADKLPVDWMIPRNNPPPFKDYNVFMQYGTRRFVSKAKRVRPNSGANIAAGALQPYQKKAYVHLDADLWLETKSFETFDVNTRRRNTYYWNRIFVTVPETHSIYTAKFVTISTPQPPLRSQPVDIPRPRQLLSRIIYNLLRRMEESRIMYI